MTAEYRIAGGAQGDAACLHQHRISTSGAAIGVTYQDPADSAHGPGRPDGSSRRASCNTRPRTEKRMKPVFRLTTAAPDVVVQGKNPPGTAPVYIGDTITAAAEVLSVHATKPVTQLAIRVTTQSGETVLEGEAWCYTFGT